MATIAALSVVDVLLTVIIAFGICFHSDAMKVASLLGNLRAIELSSVIYPSDKSPDLACECLFAAASGLKHSNLVDRLK